MNLDERFGPSRPPSNRKIEDHERLYHPMSKIEITSQTAPVIADYLKRLPHFELSSIIASTFHMLWLIDTSGRMFLAMEELVDGNGTKIGALPNAVGLIYPDYKKLGHPSLLDHGTDDARIAGELTYDPDFDPGGPDWVLSNKSGRYGTRPWQTSAHLEAVGGFLANLGLHVACWFVPPLR